MSLAAAEDLHLRDKNKALTAALVTVQKHVIELDKGFQDLQKEKEQLSEKVTSAFACQCVIHWKTHKHS